MKNFRIHFTKVYQNGEFPNTAVLPGKNQQDAEARLIKMIKVANAEQPEIVIISTEEVINQSTTPK